MKSNAFITAMSAMLVCASALGASVKVDDGVSTPDSNLSAVNKSVQVGDNAEIGNVNSVNGAIRIGSNSIVRNIESVNGSVRVRSGASLKSVEVVNGSIDLGPDVIVTGGVDSVNGRISADSGASIGDNIHTVNGSIDLTGAIVQGDLETYNGDISLSNTEILGDLRVSKSKGWNWNKKKPKANHITIGANSVIHGDLYFEKAVKLTIHPSATVGQIIGDEVDRGDMR